ncbi:MAG: ABC transporter ATP-binding protein [Clostridiales bacterium]|nr:ABC transporter ATP-binding protein [Clostridiales bacterium]
MKKLFKYIKPLVPMMSLGLAIKFLGTMMDLVIPSILAIIIDKYAKEGMESKIYLLGGIMVLCAVVSVLSNIYANRLAAVSSGKITKSIRHDLFSKISRLSARQTDNFTIPSLISRLTSDTYNINQMLARMQRIGVRAPILLLGGIIITLTLDPVLTLILAAMLPLIAVVVFFVSKSSIKLYTTVQEALDKLTRTVQENFTGVRVIKALSKTEYEKAKFEEDNSGLSKKERKVDLIMSVTNPSATAILNVGLTLVVLAGAFRSNSGLTTPGVIIAFQTYFTIMLNAMLGITRVFIMYTKGEASAKRVAEVLEAEEDIAVTEMPRTESRYHIEFKNVSFSYNKTRPNVKNITFALKRGETLGIIGSTGSGKTTIINLLNRFYDPDEGEILIDGENIKSIPNDMFRAKFGNAFQSDFIVGTTIGENIRYYRDIPEERLVLAAEHAAATEFINSYKEKMDYEIVPRGGNLSGGQKQRLLISRALAGNPEILILDDSSSALDYKTDAALRKALSRNYPQITKIIVTQRISSIRHADVILVLEDGEVIGKGKHEELVESCETYRIISQTQMGEGL